ncbi:MAG: transglycosylase domain-containing protein [Flavobacteriales bacterium]|nr:transglycosylase domain-containing protein [Flavobacteriales bacterium]
MCSCSTSTRAIRENTFGIESAAQRYFNSPTSKLKVEECAVLVGMLKANTSYNPRLHPERSKGRFIRCWS